jgi:tetratricopeptide (TPR) repeat protein
MVPLFCLREEALWNNECAPVRRADAMESAVMKLFSVPGRLFAFTSVVSTIALFLGLAGPVSAQRALEMPEDLKPIPSGPGIQICGPVASGSDAALADFGSACGLWLQWSMGFHPELGQTPRWEMAARAARELHVPRLRLSLAQSTRLVGILGVTHVAIGQITGTKAQCVLTYQLYAVPSQKPVGAPIKLAGSEEQVIAQLPQAARTLLAGLGVQKLHVPTSVGATATEMTLLGHYGPSADQAPTADEQKQMETLEVKLPLATLLLFGHNPGHNAREVEITSNRIVEKADSNFLMLGAVATMNAAHSPAFARLMDDKVAALGAPNNSLLKYWALAQARTLEERIRVAQQIVRLAPNSSNSWNTLAIHTGAQGESMRLGRVFAGLSAQEAEALINIYARWEHAAVRATTLDPDFEFAWCELAVAATFAGDPERADAAFWKAYALDKSDLRIYTWGLEMYQEKWGGDPKTLAKVAHLAAAAPLPATTNFYTLGGELRAAGFPAEAKIMFARAIDQARDWVRQAPNESYYHMMLGYYLSEQGAYPEAETELKTAITLNPKSHPALAALGKLYKNNQRYAEAIAQLREDVRITAGSNAQTEAKTALAETLLNSSPDGPFEEPEKLLNEAVKAAPNWHQPYEDLGWLLARKKEYDAAIEAFLTVQRLTPDSNIPYQELGRIYRLQSKFEEAVQEGRKAVALAPKSSTTLAELAETYAAKGDNAVSVTTYLKAIAADPKDAQGHFGLGKLYLKMGKKDEGRAELKSVLELSPDPTLKKSAQDLLDKNP